MTAKKKRTKKADIKEVKRAPRVCGHCGAVETLKTYKSMMQGIVRVTWGRCSMPKCNKVTRELTPIPDKSGLSVA